MIENSTYQNSSLGHGVLHLVSPDNLGLLQHLKSIQLSSVFFLDQHDFTIGTFSEHRYHFKILFGNVATRSRLLFANYFLVLLFNFFLLLYR